MSDLKEKFDRTDLYAGLFYPDIDTMLKSKDGNAINHTEEQQKNYEALHIEALSHGLFKPFNTENGGFFQHLSLTFKYPALHLCKVVTDLLTFNILGAVVHTIYFPFSLAYFLVGLAIRSLSTLVDLCTSSATNDKNDLARFPI